MNHSQPAVESPRVAKMSQATAISLGLVPGRMHRGAVNRCVNLLVHYPEGCSANCAYCGLAKKRPGAFTEKSFIHVAWPLFPMDEIVRAINQAPTYVKRTCISMITNGKCRRATLEMARRLRDKTSLPVSVLIAPTILHPQDLVAMKDAGVDKVGVAIDLATPELFDRYRGTGVSGPHQWNTYWEILGQCVEIFGHPHVGAHLMVGMDETEQEMIRLMDRLWHTGVVSHLFSFFAEEASALSHRPQPPWPSYLRVQLARYLIEEKLAAYEDMAFDAEGRLKDVGLGSDLVESIVDLGTPFMTTGCLGPDGAVACNRPFGNCLPDTCQWNYPYPPNPEELSLIRKCIFTYDNWKPNGVRAEGIGPMRGKTPLQGLQKSF